MASSQDLEDVRQMPILIFFLPWIYKHSRLLSIATVSQSLETTLSAPISNPILDTDSHIPVGIHEVLAPFGEATSRINGRGVASADQVRLFSWSAERQVCDGVSSGIEACESWLDRLWRRASFDSRSWW